MYSLLTGATQPIPKQIRGHTIPLPIDCEEKEQKALDARLLAVQQQVTDEGIINSEGIDVQPENARRGNISLPRLLR
ncbi:hypothetical protein [Chroococcidiopsis sp. CCMEE 29]|uniref:hypothetical protein n=1 Tax=Chroococcidiopsis sp. CCMEE 29 TaxID=155894 RepID=UPI0020221438|nr:hypothetical protein [Chroococcidiopsis sp. CCMEE 29]